MTPGDTFSNAETVLRRLVLWQGLVYCIGVVIDRLKKDSVKAMEEGMLDAID